jgi:hypothetical protein
VAVCGCVRALAAVVVAVTVASETSLWTYADAARRGCVSLGYEASDARIADPGVPHTVR